MNPRSRAVTIPQPSLLSVSHSFNPLSCSFSSIYLRSQVINRLCQLFLFPPNTHSSDSQPICISLSLSLLSSLSLRLPPSLNAKYSMALSLFFHVY